jgi:hypothetical protein
VTPSRRSISTSGCSPQIFGQERSDYVWFREPGSVPFIYFSDSTNACYHTGNDEIELVDFGKLADEAEVAFRVVLALAEADERPSFVPPPPLTDAYEDLVVMADVLASVLPDLDLLDEPYRQQLVNLEAQARQGVEAGPENYANLTAGVIALQAIQIAENGFACDPTLLPEPSAASFAALGALVALARARRRREPDGNGSTG